MSGALLRTGLWLEVAVIGSFIAADRMPDSALAAFLTPWLLRNAALVGVALVALGIIAFVVEKIVRPGTRGRCAVCRKPIAKSEIYCRAHLRGILEEEDDRLHATGAWRR